MNHDHDRERLLTETELEFMHVIWKLGDATVTDVREHLPEERRLAYTSVATIMRILEKKGVLSSFKEGRSHVFQPLLSREDYERKSLSHLLTNVFSESRTALVRRLVDSGDMTADEIREIKRILSRGAAHD